MTDRQRWLMEMDQMFRRGGMSGEMVIRYRDGEIVECQPMPKYKPPQAGRPARETGTG